MIAAISWVPKGASKSVPIAAQPPSKDEIEEMIKSGVLETRSDFRAWWFILFDAALSD